MRGIRGALHWDGLRLRVGSGFEAGLRFSGTEL